MRRVKEFLGAVGFSAMPGALRDTTNGQLLAQVPTQAWYACIAALQTLRVMPLSGCSIPVPAVASICLLTMVCKSLTW